MTLEYEEWKIENDYNSFSDYCSNLGIEIQDTKLLRNDDILSDLIIREHDNHYGITHTRDDYQDYLYELNQDDINSQGEAQYEFLAGK